MLTALGSLFRFVGLACCRFDEEAAAVRNGSTPNALSEALPLFVHWRALPHFAESPELAADLDGLNAAVRALVHEINDTAEGDGAGRAAVLPNMGFAAVHADYQRLFLAPDMVVPLWESLWRSREKLLFTQETSAVREWYARHGLEIQQVGHAAEDHLGLELFFLGWLVDQGQLDAAETFLIEHVTPWIPHCCHRLRDEAETPFWRAVFRIGEALTVPSAEQGDSP